MDIRKMVHIMQDSGIRLQINRDKLTVVGTKYADVEILKRLTNHLLEEIVLEANRIDHDYLDPEEIILQAINN